jgi:hypothetical protein
MDDRLIRLRDQEQGGGRVFKPADVFKKTRLDAENEMVARCSLQSIFLKKIAPENESGPLLPARPPGRRTGGR